jgi:hypothetical protein
VTSLKERLGQNPQRQAVVTDACHVLDQEVADKSGLGGIAIKGAYSIVKGIKPGFIEEVVDSLLNDFLDALDPIYREAQERKEPPGRYLAANGDRAADALLAITDARVSRRDPKDLRKAPADRQEARLVGGAAARTDARPPRLLTHPLPGGLRRFRAH